MNKIKDSDNNIIYEGADARVVYDLLLGESEDVTEEDEIKYENVLRKEFVGKLRLLEFDKDNNLIVYLIFKGIDDWGRPCFKDKDRQMYYGDVNKLWYGKKPDEIIEYYSKYSNRLEYFGDSFNCEPHGGMTKGLTFKIII